jgi:hypothetical protein
VLLLDGASAEITASDDDSGLANDPTGTVRIDTTHAGTQVIERTATDNVGHSRTERCTVDVRYPTPGAPAVTDGGNPNAGTFALGWRPSAPAGYPLRYVLERRAAGEQDWHGVKGGLEAAAFALQRGVPADEGTWTYRVKGVDGDLETAWSEVSAPVIVDQTAPAAPTLTTDRAPEYGADGGWFRDAVTVTTTDGGDPALRDGSAPSGVDPDSVAAPQRLTASATVSGTVRDRVGNESVAAVLPVKVDATGPSLALDCPSSVALHGQGAVTVRAADLESGLATDPTGVVAIDTGHVGAQVVERTATDNVGHTRTERCEVLVRYEYGGLQQPVNPDGSSIFKLGSTVPLKMQLTDAAGVVVTTAVAKVELERVSTTVDGTRVEEVVDATPTNGKAFEVKGDSYHFNLSTKPLSVGTWRIKLSIDDGTIYRTNISLR